jgi:exosortase
MQTPTLPDTQEIADPFDTNLPAGVDRKPVFLLVAAGLLVWVNWAIQLSLFWDEKSYYNYGWAVPILALFLVWRRIRTAPGSQSSPGIGSLLLIAGLLSWPAVQAITEAIPNWRLIAWGHTGAVILLTLGIAATIGGRRFAIHVAFPVFFLATALPWPMRFEIPIISNLTEGVVQFTVVTLRIFAIPAIYTGNVIEVGDRTVMVGDVCSGIRSLQALIMVGLFFGEFFRHGVVKRVGLVLAAGFFAFAFNCLRALTLTLIVLYGEPETFDKWHDWIGALAFGGACLGLFFVSERLNKYSSKDESADEKRFSPRPVRTGLGVTVLAWVLVFFTTIELWFRHHDLIGSPRESLVIQWPEANMQSGFRFLKVPGNVNEFLRFDHGERAEFYLPDGSRIEIYYFTWDKGVLGMEAADNHSPDICMVRNGGAVVESRTKPVPFTFDTVNIPFDTYQMRYPQIDQPFQTFRAVWLRGPKESLNEIVSFRTRNQSIADHFRGAIERVRAGKRDFPVAMLLIGIEGKASIEEAWTALEGVLQDIAVENEAITES